MSVDRVRGRADLVEIRDEGVLKHYFFDIGQGQLMGFMSGEDVNGYPKDFDAGINKGLGLKPGVYHFAFDAESESELHRIKAHLESHGVKVLGPVDHGMCKSIYFFDPNGHRLELAVDTMTPEMRRSLASVSGPMLEEWSRTKKAPRHAGWVHTKK